MQLIFFLIFLCSACQTGSRSHVKSTSAPKFIDLRKIKDDLEPCGLEGKLLVRINDCTRKNPSLNQYVPRQKRMIWQQIHYNAELDFHLWLDSEQNLIWSSPLAADKREFCKEALAFKNGNSSFVVRIPSLTEYRTLFSYDIPPLLYKSKAQFFEHNDMAETGMVADERNKNFRNAPDSNIWIRCIGE